MSAFVPMQRPNFARAMAYLTTQDRTAVYTADEPALLRLVLASNRTPVGKNVTVELFDAATSARFSLLYNAPIQGNSAMQAEYLACGIPLKVGDRIEVTASAGNSVDAIVVVETRGARSQ